MNRNLRLSYILFFVFSTILIAFKTLSNFFGGVALNFVTLLALVFVVTLICLKEKHVFTRIKDLLIVSCVFIVLEIIIYFAFEFSCEMVSKGFFVYQNVISALGMLFLIYIGVRFTLDYLNKKVKFFEVILGNEKIVRKEKKAKEISNGTLEDKPNHRPFENLTLPDEDEEEIEIEIEE